MYKLWLLSAAVLVLAGHASAAETGDTTAAVMSDCSGAGVPAAAVDSCLERVRILEQTDSSPQLASLEARLESRVAADREPTGPTQAGNGSVEVRPYSASTTGAEPDTGAADDTYDARTATGAPRSLEAEEPYAAAPDNPATDDSADEGAAPDNGVASGAHPAAAGAPPYVSPDDEPPIADPPDSDAPPDGRDGSPPGAFG